MTGGGERVAATASPSARGGIGDSASSRSAAGSSRAFDVRARNPRNSYVLPDAANTAASPAVDVADKRTSTRAGTRASVIWHASVRIHTS